MHFIFLFKVSDMRLAIRFYTEVLNFRMTWPIVMRNCDYGKQLFLCLLGRILFETGILL